MELQYPVGYYLACMSQISSIASYEDSVQKSRQKTIDELCNNINLGDEIIVDCCVCKKKPFKINRSNIQDPTRIFEEIFVYCCHDCYVKSLYSEDVYIEIKNEPENTKKFEKFKFK